MAICDFLGLFGVRGDFRGCSEFQEVVPDIPVFQRIDRDSQNILELGNSLDRLREILRSMLLSIACAHLYCGKHSSQIVNSQNLYYERDPPLKILNEIDNYEKVKGGVLHFLLPEIQFPSRGEP